MDIVKRGINGDLFDTAHEAITKILQYYNNREMLDVMGHYSEQICRKEFNVKENYKAYRALYAGTLPHKEKAAWSFG